MQYKCNPEDKLHLPLKGDCTEHWQEQYLLLFLVMKRHRSVKLIWFYPQTLFTHTRGGFGSSRRVRFWPVTQAKRVGSIRYLLSRRCREVVQVKSSTLEDTRNRSIQGTKCTCCQREAALPIDLANGPLGQASFHKRTAHAICKADEYTGW